MNTDLIVTRKKTGFFYSGSRFRMLVLFPKNQIVSKNRNAMIKAAKIRFSKPRENRTEIGSSRDPC